MLEVSGVDSPANKTQVGAEGWLVVKQDGTEGSTTVAADESTDKAKDGDETEKDESEVAKLKERIKDLEDTLGHERKARREAEDTAEKFKAQQEAKKDESGEGGDAGESDPIAKALADPDTPDVVKAALRATAQRAEAAEKAAAADREAVAKMRDEDLTRQFVAKAATFSHLGTTPEAFGPILKAAAGSMDAETYVELERILTSAEKASAEAERILAATTGASNASTAPVTEKVRTLVMAKQAADPSLDAITAEAAVWAEHPELVTEYRASATEGA